VVVLAVILIGFQMTQTGEEGEEGPEGCGEGTVIYGDESLCWQQSIMPSKPGNWQAANDYCENLVLGGDEDWRLPTEGELLTIIDTSFTGIAIDTKYFKDTLGVPFWTSTPGEYDNSHRFVNFQTGYRGSSFDFTKDLGVRCVRDKSLIEY
jgi:hypothetical protein